jgi:hypothetical protein
VAFHGSAAEVVMRVLFALFLIGHGVVHSVMWGLPFTEAVSDMPFDPGHSWLLGTQHTVGAVGAGLATLLYAATAIGYLAEATWWPASMLAGSVVSLTLMALFMSPWWLVGILMSAALIGVAVRVQT